MERVGETVKRRKTRSDKKRDVKPTVSSELKNCVYRLSYITNTPVKDVVETICEKGLQNRNVIDYLSQYFLREYHFKNTVYMGDFGRESLQRKYQSGKNERITTRFSQITYENVKDLSDALDVTPSKATALLLDASIRNTNLLNAYVKRYLHGHIDQRRMTELKQVLAYVKKNNPYGEDMSWYTLLSIIFEEVKESTVNVKAAVNHWLDKIK